MNVLFPTADGESPTLVNCPQNLTLIVEKDTDEIIADWTPPTASDNSGMVNLTTNLEPGQSLLPGQYNVMYTATDPARLISTCPTFTVTVESSKGPLFFVIHVEGEL